LTYNRTKEYSMKKSPSLVAILLVAALLFSATPLPAASIAVQAAGPLFQRPDEGPPPEHVETASTASLSRLAPELRAAAQAGGEQPLLVTVVMQPGTDPSAFLQRFALSRVVAGVQWAAAEVLPARLEKLASLDGVLAVISPETFQSAEAPGLDELRHAPQIPTVEQARRWMLAGRPIATEGPEVGIGNIPTDPRPTPTNSTSTSTNPVPTHPAPDDLTITRPLEIHGAPAVHAQGLRGQDVRIALVDTGVDFGHPDLQGTQAKISGGPYDGWPFAYDVVSGARYALQPGYAFDPGNQMAGYGYTRYAHTLPVSGATCDGLVCSADLSFDLGQNQITLPVLWPDTSLSGQYYYTLHPDYLLPSAAFNLGLGYPQFFFGMPVVITADRTQAGIYDTVYVDVNYDNDLTSLDERMERDHPLAGADLNGDRLWDLSAGMLAWISDGQNHPPGVTTLYPAVASTPVPGAGRLLAFIGDENSHGTNCAGQIAAQGVISDPTGLGPRSPYLNGPILQGIAPKASLVAIQNGYELPLDSWTLAALGLDGLPQSGDEVQVVSNSWGASALIEDGWDVFSRFIAELNRTDAPNTVFLAATGNGGHGYATVTSPSGGTILDIGASTFNGESRYFEQVLPQQFLYGDVQPWSNRGPGTQGDIAPDLTTVGAWGLGINPLNAYYGNAQTSYDLFGGTSMSTPLAAGGMALVYQAYRQAHGGQWPTWQQARELLLGGAQDLGYDALTQGSGDLRVDRSVSLALDAAPRVSPAQWTPGAAYPAYPALLQAGDSAAQTFTLTNPLTTDQPVSISATQLQAVHVETFQVPYTYPRPSMPSIYPLYLEDLTAWVNAYDPDLLRAEVILPFPAFDSDNNYYFENGWEIFFYNWTDLDGDTILWHDLDRDDQIDAGELDVDPVSGLSEYNRFASAYPGGTALQIEVGREAIALARQSGQGLFLGLDCYFCGASTTLQVRLTFYREQPWSWVNLPESPLLVPAGGSFDLPAAFTVPPGTAPGAYQGSLHLDFPDRTQSVPVLVNVPAPLDDFNLSASAPSGQPFDNTRLAGGFDWRWRYESGDWHIYYYTVPPGSASPNTRLVADTHWNSRYTDVDTWLFGSSPDPYSSSAPAFFGPSGMSKVGGSADTYTNNGRFLRETTTGYAREVVSGELRDGLGMLVTHNVLYGGDQFSEPFSASVYQVQVWPSPSDLLAAPLSLDPPRLSGSTAFQFLSGGDIPDGLRLQAYGFAPRLDLTRQPIRQDPPSNICAASWRYPELLLVRGGQLQITLDAVRPASADLDLYLYEDNGNERFECGTDPLAYYSNATGSEDSIKINFPLDANYWLIVHGYNVPGGSGDFDLTIRNIHGNEFHLRDLPLGPVEAGVPVDFQAVYNAAYAYTTPVTLDGVLFVGLPGVPDLLDIPVTLRPTTLLRPAPRLWFDRPSIWAGTAGLLLSVTNLGALTETLQIALPLPPELSFAGAPPGGLNYDSIGHQLLWTGPVPAGETIVLQASLAAAPGTYAGPVTVSGTVQGLISGQLLPVSAQILLRQARLYFPIIKQFILH
jgi:hypothetical protein